MKNSSLMYVLSLVLLVIFCFGCEQKTVEREESPLKKEKYVVKIASTAIAPLIYEEFEKSEGEADKLRRDRKEKLEIRLKKH